MGVFSQVFGLRRNSSFSKDGSSRRGRRPGGEGSLRSGQDDPSNSKDSSTSSALFDLELSQRAGRAGDLLARLNPSVHALDGSSTHASGDPSVRLPSGLLQRIIYLSRPVMEFELDLLQDLRALRSTAQRGPDGQLDLAALVAALQGLGYACYLKRNNPGDPGHRHSLQPSCLEKLRHEFVVCAGRADGSLAHWCLVDPRFRDQFAIAQPTPTYDRCLKALPLEFVGTPLRLHALVEVMCAEMADAFASSGRMLPPWRKLKSMLSKWFDPEEMPGAEAPMTPPPLAPASTQPQPPLSPFDAAAGAPQGAGGQSLLQLQAAAALAERQSSGGGSQDFYDALAMHQESMRRAQQQAQQGGAAPPSPQQQQAGPARQQQARSPSPASQRQQAAHAAAAAALMSDAAYLDAAWQAAATEEGSGGVALSSARDEERSNKPRRRAAGARAAAGQPWGVERVPAATAGGGSKAACGHAQLGAIDLQASGSWSDLSTILETTTNSTASSPAAALLMAANCPPGLSASSRRSAAAAQPAGPITLAQLTHSRSRAASATGSYDNTQHGPGSASGASAASAARSAGLSGPPPLPPHSVGAPSPRSDPSPGSSGHDMGNSSPGGAAASAEQAGSERGRKKAVSLLARSLKSVGQKQAWQNFLPSISTVRRMGPAGQATPQRSWSWRPGSDSGDGSGRRGRRMGATGTQQPYPPRYPQA